jgi:hypothetical protein
MTAMPLTLEDTHTLRGPRQAGKTTTLKRLIKRLVENGEQRILYFSFDTVRHPGAIGQARRSPPKNSSARMAGAWPRRCSAAVRHWSAPTPRI